MSRSHGAEMHSPWIFPLALSSRDREQGRDQGRERKRKSYSCLSEEGLSLSISRRRGGGRGVRADESRARARRAAIYTKSVGIPDRWPRQNALARLASPRLARESESPLSRRLPKSPARGEERRGAASGDEAPASPALGDCHFRSPGPPDEFCAFHATIDPLKTITAFFFILTRRYIRRELYYYNQYFFQSLTFNLF